MQTELSATPIGLRIEEAGRRGLLRVLTGIGALLLLVTISTLHALIRGIAYQHHLLPAASAGPVEDLLWNGGGPGMLQTIIPASTAEHPALVIWSSLFWVSPVLMFSVGAAFGPRHVLRLLLLHTSVLIVSDSIFFIVPTMPPWMADGAPRLLAHSAADTLQVDNNPIAALPSLHVAVPLIAALWLWNHEHVVCRLLGRLWMLRAALMFWAVVYTGEHYMLDGIAGIAVAFAVYRFYDRFGLAQFRSLHPPPILSLNRFSARRAGAQESAAA